MSYTWLWAEKVIGTWTSSWNSLNGRFEQERESWMGISQASKRQVREPPAGTTASFLSPSSTPSCSYCQQVHFSGECGTVTSPDERKQILRRSGRCFICLKKVHISKNCHSSNRCRKCGGRHHTSMCTKGSSGGSRTDNKPPKAHSPQLQISSTLQPQGLNNQAGTFVPTTTAMCTNSTTAVLLQTVRADVYNPLTPQSLVKVRVLLDSSSQHHRLSSEILSLAHSEAAEDADQDIWIRTRTRTGMWRSKDRTENCRWSQTWIASLLCTHDLRAIVTSSDLSLQDYLWSLNAS